MSNTEIIIAAAQRTPLGAFQGVFTPVSAPALGAAALKGALEAAAVAPADVEEVILGCVLPAGLGQAPARQAAIAAGVPLATPATTVNKMCGSGLKTVMMAADQIRAGSAQIAATFITIFENGLIPRVTAEAARRTGGAVAGRARR